jgi:hypothetical protein
MPTTERISHLNSESRVFFFDPAHQGYAASTQPLYHTLRLHTVRHERSNALLGGCLLFGSAGVFTVFGGGALLAFWLAKHVIGLVLVAILLLASGLIVMRGIFRVYQYERKIHEKWKRLIQPGQAHILSGVIDGHRVQELAGYGGGRYRTFVSYFFTNHEGKQIRAEQSRMGKIDVPPMGSSVRVLYLDDSTFVLL